jgi:hypothetical protein
MDEPSERFSDDDAITLVRGEHDDAVGRTILIGLKYFRRGTLLRKLQLHGRIEAIGRVLSVRIEGRDEPFTLPPDVLRAPPGRYRLHDSDAVVDDPDFLAVWAIHEPDRCAEAALRRRRTAALRRARRRERR